MQIQKGHENEGGKRGKQSYWTEAEHKKLLEFLILHPHKVGQSATGSNTISCLHKFVGDGKTQKQCLAKMMYLKGKFKSYEDIVNGSKVLVYVDNKWVQERKNQVKYFSIKVFENEIKTIRQPLSIQDQALRMLMSNFNYNEALFVNERFPSSSMLLNKSSIESEVPSRNKQHLEANSSEIVNLKIVPPDDNAFDQKIHSSNESSKVNFQSEKSENLSNKLKQKAQEQVQELVHKNIQQDHIEKLRYVLFLEKYKNQFQSTQQVDLTDPIFLKMTNFIETKNSLTWRVYYTRRMQKVNDFEKIIEKAKEDLYVTKEEIIAQTGRIEKFYRDDISKEMKAFISKSYFTIQSSNHEISLMVQNILEQLVKKLNVNTLNDQNVESWKKDEQNQQEVKGPNSNLFEKRFLIKFPIELNVTLRKDENQDHPDQITYKTSKIGSKTRNQMQPQDFNRNLNFATLSKKERLKEKRRVKKSKRYDFSMDDQELFLESDQDFEKEQACNNFPVSYDKQQSESDESNNQSDEEENVSNQNKKTVKKRSGYDRLSKMSSQSDPSNNFEKQGSKQSNVKQKNGVGRKRVWTISQKMKLMSFLEINKETFLSGDSKRKYDIIKKLADYIGTKKSHQKCKFYLKRIKKNYNNDLCNLIEDEENQFRITSGLLDQCKQLGDRYMQRCEVNLGSSTLMLDVYPKIHVISTMKTLDEEIEKIIRKGPFVEAKLKLFSQQGKTNLEQQDTKQSMNTTVIKMENTIKYTINLKISSKVWIQVFGQYEKNQKQIIIKDDIYECYLN